MKNKKKPAQNDENGQIVPIGVGNIRSGAHNIRKEYDVRSLIHLAESIRQFGILQPIAVRRLSEDEREVPFPESSPIGDPTAPGPEYETVFGERRLRAAKILGMREVPCVILPIGPAKAHELALTENMQREDPSPFDIASGIAELTDLYGLKPAQIAMRLAQPTGLPDRMRTLLAFPHEQREIVTREGLSERHLLAVLSLPSEEARSALLRAIVDEGLSAKQTELRAKESLVPHNAPKKAKFLFRDTRILSNTIARAVESIEEVGVHVEKTERVTDDAVEIILRIPNPAAAVKERST